MRVPRYVHRILGPILLAVGTYVPVMAQQPTLQWQPWSDAVFQQAKAEHKFVLLDLEAVWCHWCHVMDEVTYRDPIVIRLLSQKYILVKVDQDSRPDISNRYQDYGWPATVVFAADGSEIVKRQGYIPPRPMSSMLQAIIDDPSPGPSVVKEADFHPAANAEIPAALQSRIASQFEKQYDPSVAGWGFGHKYLDRDSVEYALRLAAQGNVEYAKRVDDTLHNATALLDPAWGGMYQYSVGGHWSEPHFEKLISIQADALHDYSLAFAQTQNREYLDAAQAVHRYVENFLTSSATGAFFVSQDADLHDGQENESYFKLSDHDRRVRGIPRVDKHMYARENGWMIAALCDEYAATGDDAALTEAQRATAWIASHRILPGGGFRHGDADPGGPYLGDTLAMGRAFLALYNVTGNRDYLKKATAAAQFIDAHFQPASPGRGYLTSQRRSNSADRPHPDRDENIALVRFTSLLALASGDANFRSISKEAMRYLAADPIALAPMSAGILLANQDVTEAPLHVTIVGPVKNPSSIMLRNAALRSIASHELIELRDPSDPSPLPTRVAFPQLDHPALFLCSERSCSSPVFAPENVRTKVLHAQVKSAQ